MKIVIEARRWWNDTGVDVSAGDVVTVTAEGAWTDSTIKSGPDGFSDARLDRFAWAKRDRHSPWFCLTAVVGRFGPCHSIGRNGSFRADRGGRVRLFANDAWLFYFNNKGEIEGTISVNGSARAREVDFGAAE